MNFYIYIHEESVCNLCCVLVFAIFWSYKEELGVYESKLR